MSSRLDGAVAVMRRVKAPTRAGIFLDAEMAKTVRLHRLDAAARTSSRSGAEAVGVRRRRQNGPLGDLAALSCRRFEIAAGVVVLPAPLAGMATMPPYRTVSNHAHAGNGGGVIMRSPRCC